MSKPGLGPCVLSVLLLVALLAAVTFPAGKLVSNDDIWIASAPSGGFDLAVIYAAAGRYLGAALVFGLSLVNRQFADFVPLLQVLVVLSHAIFALVFVAGLRRDLPRWQLTLLAALILAWPYNVDLYIFKVLYPNLILGFALLSLVLRAHPRFTYRADACSLVLIAAVQACYQPLAYYYLVFVAARMLVQGFDGREFRRAGLRFVGGMLLYTVVHLLVHGHFLELARQSVDPVTFRNFAQDRGAIRSLAGMVTGALEYGYIVLRSLGAPEPIAGAQLKAPLLATALALGLALLRPAEGTRARRALNLASLCLLLALMGSPFQVLIDYDSFPPRALTHVGAVFAAMGLALSLRSPAWSRPLATALVGFAVAASAVASHLVLRDGVAVGDFDRTIAREICAELTARGDVARVRFVNVLPDRTPILGRHVIYYNINLSAFSRPWSHNALVEATCALPREVARAEEPAPFHVGPTGTKVYDILVQDGVAFVYFNQAELPRGEPAIVERLRAFKRRLQARSAPEMDG